MRYSFYLLLYTIVFGCAGPYSSTNKQYKKQAKAFAQQLRSYPLTDSLQNMQFVGTTNFGMRKPSMIILHHTAQNSCDQTLRTFTLPRTAVSSHYVVCRHGNSFHMLSDLLRGQHAGVSSWGGTQDVNSSSIGIEIDNNGSEIFSAVQIESVISLLKSLKSAYRIADKHIVGHADIAPCRKVDPSRYFPWKQLADAGVGLWYDTTSITVPPDFNALHGLRMIGYNISKPECAVQSYKIHFVPQDTTNLIYESDRKIIYSLVQKTL